MANVNQTLVTNFLADPHAMNPVHHLGGRMRVASGTIALAAGDLSASDTAMLCPLPTNASVISIKLYNDDLDSGSTNTTDVGLYSADGEVTRDAEDLDKSVRELAAEGKLEADFDARPPPDGLAAAHEGDELVVTATQPVNNLWLMALVALFPLIFVYVGFSEGGFVYVFAAFGLLFEVLIVAGIVWDVLTRQRLRIGRDHVSKQWVAAWGAGRPKRLDADSIESVTITAKEGGRPRHLAIASDDRTLRFGRRQSDATLEWLRRAVLAHIAAE